MRNISNSPDDINKMQQEAIRRAKDMHSRAARPQNEPQKKCEETKQEKIECCTQKTEQKSSGFIPLSPVHGILDVIMKDSEKSLILALILLLVQENADISIVLALMYLII